MGVKRFEDLQVYRLAEELADEIWSLVAPRLNAYLKSIGPQPK